MLSLFVTIAMLLPSAPNIHCVAVTLEMLKPPTRYVPTKAGNATCCANWVSDSTTLKCARRSPTFCHELVLLIIKPDTLEIIQSLSPQPYLCLMDTVPADVTSLELACLTHSDTLISCALLIAFFISSDIGMTISATSSSSVTSIILVKLDAPPGFTLSRPFASMPTSSVISSVAAAAFTPPSVLSFATGRV